MKSVFLETKLLQISEEIREHFVKRALQWGVEDSLFEISIPRSFTTSSDFKFNTY